MEERKKLNLIKDENVQLQMFENDVQKMLDWIKKNRDLLMIHCLQIGRNSNEVKALQEEHNHFGVGSMNVYVNINR